MPVLSDGIVDAMTLLAKQLGIYLRSAHTYMCDIMVWMAFEVHDNCTQGGVQI